VYVGLAVTSHNASATSTATFTDVTITQTGGTGEPQPPTVTLTAPASGTTYSAPAAVLLRATASDDGAVEKVEFFANGQSVGTDTEIPYEATFNAGEGTYNLTAVATDDSGASTTSSTATVTVISTPNSPPTASIGSPANGASFVAPANITINATAEDADGAIARVEFYAGTQLIGTATASPFSITWADVAAGSYSLTAVARDDEGASTTSGAISVVVNSSPGPGTGVAFVQQAGRDAGTATSASLAFPAPNTSGNLIAVVVRASSLDQVFTVTDTRGNQYRKAIQFNVTADGVSLAMFYAENVGGGTNTVTVRDTQSGTLRFSILEYSGIAPGTALDVATAAEGSGTLADSGTVTTTSDGVLVLGAFAAANPVSVTAGSGYTLRSTVPANPSAKLAVEDTLQPKAGPVSATASLSAGEVWGSVVAVFRPAGSAPPPAPPGAPTSPSPADGATSIGSGAALSWSASGASTYDVRLGTSSNPPLVASNLTSATYTPAALATNTTYFWQVVARNAAGTATSPIWSFTTSTAPPPPTPTSVAFTASEDHDTLVTSYTVAIYRAGDPVTGTPIASQDLGKPAPSGGDITVDISGIVDPLAAGSYFAVVSAVGAGGSAASAPSANFTK
jgi:hypothetical protein